jgi:hypothetical protein
MAYKVSGLAREDFAELFAMGDAELAERNACRVRATGGGFPCRVSLKDAEAGDMLILLHHVSHDVATPYRSSYAIYVNESSRDAAPYVDTTPPVFEGRPIALRGFDADGMLKAASLAAPGQADAKIREVLANPEIAYIHAHNAAHGCYSARIDRYDD